MHQMMHRSCALIEKERTTVIDVMLQYFLQHQGAMKYLAKQVMTNDFGPY